MKRYARDRRRKAQGGRARRQLPPDEAPRDGGACLVLAAGDNVHILFIGANAMPHDLREQTRAKAAELGVADAVHFVEDTENVPAYLGVCDIGINCSEGEGLSNAIMEYMAAGIPATVAASGGNPDLIEHEKTGLLFELDDAAGLAANIRRLVQDPALARRLAEAAQRHAEAQFDLHAMADHFHALYVKLGGNPRSNGPLAAPPVAR
jgi:glycosyltransferase involved in cell wall biosynthesis